MPAVGIARAVPRHSLPRIAVPATALALSAATLGSLASCSDDKDAAAVVDEAGAAADARPHDGQAEVDADDAGIDAPAPPVTLPACVGGAIPMNVVGERAFVSVGIESIADGGYAAHGDFVVDFGSIGSTIDLHAFGDAGPTPTSCAGDASAPGADCTFQGFDFFGDWGTVYLRTADHSTLVGIRQAGILATDFLARNPYALDFTNQRIHRNDPSSFCTDAQLLGAGFRPLTTAGFYSSDLSKLRPLSEVLDNPDASAGYVVPNVPTVPVSIAGLSSLAQLDTGYEDRLSKRSINVNDAYLAALMAKPGLVTRFAGFDLYATTCVPGLSEKLEAYVPAAGTTLDFVGEGGSVVRSDAVETIFVKHGSPETFRCGGISTWTVPAAQVGASFYVDAQALIVDPVASRVWVPSN